MIFVDMLQFSLIVCNINGYEKMLHFSLMGKHRNIEEYIRQTAAKEKQKIKESVLEGIYIIHNVLDNCKIIILKFEDDLLEF